tara:strand:+ start:5629 stop:5880 length:252 start_codon:yes stop_codon:yes gene_type:complete
MGDYLLLLLVIIGILCVLLCINVLFDKCMLVNFPGRQLERELAILEMDSMEQQLAISLYKAEIIENELVIINPGKQLHLAIKL